MGIDDIKRYHRQSRDEQLHFEDKTGLRSAMIHFAIVYLREQGFRRLIA
ncbi:MAG: hypothetical protein GX978_06190 [Tissierellia bacterium]|nr:hypothetical protein [Tissierellia bacterium]